MFYNVEHFSLSAHVYLSLHFYGTYTNKSFGAKKKVKFKNHFENRIHCHNFIKSIKVLSN